MKKNHRNDGLILGKADECLFAHDKQKGSNNLLI